MRDASIHIPGQGCGCTLCRRPVPQAAPMTLGEAMARQAVYQAQRAAWRELHGIPSGPAGRGIKTRPR